MKELYNRVPWFEELENKIADGGEQYLAEKAKQVNWKGELNMIFSLPWIDSGQTLIPIMCLIGKAQLSYPAEKQCLPCAEDVNAQTKTLVEKIQAR